MSILNLLVLAYAALTASTPALAAPSAGQAVFSTSSSLSDPASPAKGTPRSLVIWHGLGDSAHADGIDGFIDEIKEMYPGIFVHSVSIPTGGNADAERKAGFFGKAEDQAQEGCEQIASVPELAGGFDAMGFSQGGLFLRSYVQNCNNPPVHNLMTFGTPHYGISALLPCPTPPTVTCLLAARAARAGIYSSYAQNHLIQAQYYRDVERLEAFWDINTFLTDLNNDHGPGELQLAEPNTDSKGRLDGLNSFVAVMFDADRTVSPAQSAHFWTYAPGNKTVLVPLEAQEIYTEDRIGLRKLDQEGKLFLEHCPGEHMDLDSGDCAKKVLQKWVGRAA